MNDFKQSVVNIPEICVQHGVNDIVLCPGSRSAPLALAFLRHPATRCRTIVDERSAGYIGLGLAQFYRKPVGLVCTSGTAALNFAPAVVEAFYQRIPLVVFTADRPPEWIDQEDGQTIHQCDLFVPHCHISLNTPVDDSHPDAKWHFQRLISDAINTSIRKRGPVHINVPLREPLYPAADFASEEIGCIRLADTVEELSADMWDELKGEWQQAKRRLVIVGLSAWDDAMNAALANVADQLKVPVLADITSNIKGFTHPAWFDAFLDTSDRDVLSRLRPDLVVKLGGPVVSKSLKLMLRRSRPEHIWLLQDEPKVIDTFKGATRLLPVSLLPFIKALPEKISATGNGEYFSTWSRHDEKAGRILTVKLADLDFCEIAVMHKVLQQLPDYGNLHLGNSSIVRLASMVGFIPGSRQQVFSNRGTSGIDGILSTAVGSALASQVLTTVILGDLSFFYDRNALWNRYVPEHLRVVVFNNDGGGIFRLLEGSRELPELNHHFEVEHGLSAEMTAKEHGLEYLQCNDWRSLEACLPQLFREKSGPALLEIFFDKNVSSRAFFEFKSEIEEIK